MLDDANLSERSLSNAFGIATTSDVIPDGRQADPGSNPHVRRFMPCCEANRRRL